MRLLLSALALLTFATACRSPKQTETSPPLTEAATVLPVEPRPEVPTTRPPQKPVPTPATPAQTPEVFDSRALNAVDAAILDAIAAKKAPGGVLWAERLGQAYHKAYGNRSVQPGREPMTEDTIFDMASLTKVIATAPAIVKLIELGKLQLEDPVAKYLPEFGANNKGAITIRHLLTHSSGLRPGLSLSPAWVGNEKAIELACAEKLQTPPDQKFKYSDINFILLGELVHRVSGLPLHEFTQKYFYGPLGMADTGFLPRSTEQARIAPTTVTETGVTRGIVHDPTSARMGGVAGHAGLFSTAHDLAIFARMLLNQGRHQGQAILSAESVATMTRNHAAEAIPHQRGLGWDIASPYSSPRGHLFELGSYGHTGWTGTSIWIDPFSQTFVIFLSNRNHPTEDGSVVALRRTISTRVAEAILGYSFPKRAPANQIKRQPNRLNTRNGIDVLAEEDFKTLQGLQIGLITNHTGKTREKNSTIDLLHNADAVSLVSLFSPEHGIRGVEDSQVADSRDTATGLHIHSLYGETRKPLPEHLEGLDALVFDIQDIGCRFYTYISTMGLAMEAAAEAGIRFIVLDRINPIAGHRVEGPVLAGKTNFVAYHSLPIRHGMTVGELAQMFRTEKNLELDLHIVRLKDWQRSAWQDQTRIPWINPSPNMRSLTEAALYPGIGLLEMADLSVGRGTDTPFEHIGAPYIDGAKLATELAGLNLPGVTITATQFTPNASKFAHEACQGVRFELTDREALRPIELGLHIARILHRDHPESFDLKLVNRLLKHEGIVQALQEQQSIVAIKESWQPDLDAFKKRRAAFLLYP